MKQYPQAPVLVDVHITSHCNMKCSFCSANATLFNDKKNDMSFSQIKNLFDQFEEAGVLKISIGGGEPLIRSDCLDILELTKSYSFSTMLNTNGILVDKDIAKKLSKVGLDEVAVSLDSSDPIIHEKSRNAKGVFEKTVKGIKNLINNNVPTATLITLTSENIDSVIDTINFNAELGIKRVTIMLLCPTGRAANNYNKVMYDYDKWKLLLVKLTKLYLENKMPLKLDIIPPNEGEVFWELYLPLKEVGMEEEYFSIWNQNRTNNLVTETRGFSCRAGITASAISPDGGVYGCDLMISEPALCAGNIREQSFKEIWLKSKTFKKIRGLDFSKSGACNNCKIEKCGGGCRVSALCLTGNLESADIRCPLTRSVDL